MKSIFKLFSTLTLIFVLSLGSVFAQMNGTYTINPSGSGTRNYTTWSAAISALTTSGVNGAVVFDVSANTFTQQVSIGTITGTSATNTVTFKGAGAANTKLTFAASSSTARHTLAIANGAKYLIFRDLTIEGTSTTYAWPLHIIGTTMTDIRFVKCNITAPVSTSTVCIPVVMSNSTSSNTTGGTATRVSIDSSTVTGGYYGVSVYGLTGTTTRDQDIFVTNTSILNYYLYGVYANNVNNLQIINNYLKSTTTTTSTYGIYISGAYGYNNGGTTGYACRVNNNTVDATGTYGIYLATYTGLTTSYNELINNEILGNFRSTTTQYGIYTSGASYVKIYHNTSVVNNSTTSTAAAWYNSSGSFLDVRNNNFIGIGTSRPLYIASAPSSSTINYNNYYLWGGTTGNLIYWAGTDYTNTNFTTVGGANSYNANQNWTSLTNLAVSNACINGISVGVTTDHNGATRNNPPDIGAYEASGGVSYDIMSTLVSPVAPASTSNTVKLAIRNMGSVSISSLDAAYQIGTASPVSQTFTLSSSLASCSYDTLTFSTSATLSGCTNLSAWNGVINGSNADQNNTNDTSKIQVGVGVSGTFTVGGTGADFANLNAALNSIKCGGLSGPVEFKLNAQTFNEQLVIGNIPGMSSTNTITFRGAGMNSTRLSFFATTSGSNHTLRLEGTAKFIIFRDMTIMGTSGTYAWPVHIFGNEVSDIQFINCNINAPASSSTLIIPVLINNSLTSYSTNSTVNRIKFDSCDISGGWAAIVGYGATASNAVKHQDIEVTNSNISNFYQYGIYAYYWSNSQIINNRVTAGSGATTSSYGIFLQNNSGYSNGGNTGFICRINRNYVDNNGYYGIYASNLTGASGFQNELINNVILGDQRYTSGAYSMYLTSCTYTNIYHNSVATTQSISNSYGACYISSGSFLDIRNNSFIGYGSTPALKIGSMPSSSTLDYNNYFNWTGNPVIVNVVSTDYTSSTFQSIAGANSTNLNLGWPSLTDLSISDGCINGANVGIMIDRNGNSRDSIPDRGAYEVPTSAFDAGVLGILSPTTPANSGPNTVSILVKNFGTQPFDTLDISYKYGTNSAVNESVYLTADLNSCELDTFTFSTSVSLSGCNNISAWTSNPDSHNDGISTNDTLSAQIGVGLSGSYTVGGTSPDYANLNDAIAAIQCSGLNGPTTLLIRPGTYNGQVNFGNLATSSTNTLTIKSSTGKPEDVILTDSAILTNSRHVVRFLGSKNMILRDVTIINRSKIYGWGVHMMGGCENIRVTNCIISVDSINSSSTNYIPVIINGSDNGYTTGGYFTNITLDSNRIYNGYMGIDLYGTSSPLYPDKITIKNNWIGNQYLYGLYLNILTDVLIEGNTIVGRVPNATTSGYGISMSSVGVYNSKPAPRILSNKINHVGIYGIYLSSCDGTATDSILIANNMIGGLFRSSTTYGVYATSSDYCMLYHNSIWMKGGTSTAYGAYLTSSTYWNVKNNHFAIAPGTITTSYPLYISTNTGHTVDYNNYYNPSGTYMLYRAATYDVTTYRTASAGGDSSQNYNPMFVSDLNLNMMDGCNLTTLGMPLSKVTTDIYGNPRSTTNTAIGAHEPGGWSYDIEIVRVINPTFPTLGGVQSVSLLIKNMGSSAINSLDASFQFNNGTIVNQTFTFSSPLNRCDSTVITFTNSLNINTCASFSVWTGAINGSNTDQFVANNQFNSVLGVGFSGNYTVGGASPDFATLNDAFSAMSCAGIAGHTVLNIAPGTYNGQVNIPNLFAGPNNTLTIRSATGKAADVVLTDSTINTSSRYVVRFNGATYTTLRDVTVINRSKTLGWGVHVFNSSMNCRISNCVISVDSTNSSSTNYIPLVVSGSETSYSTGGTSMNIAIDSNRIEYGYFGITLYGLTAPYSEGIKVRNNYIHKAYLYGIYGVTLTDLLIDGNRIDNNTRTTSGYGISLSSVSSQNGKPAAIVTNNYLTNIGNYGIYFSSCSGTTTLPGIVANNSIGGGYRTTGYGIYMTSSNYWNVWHNSTNLLGNGGTFYGYFGSSSSYQDIRNNNFAITDGAASTSSYAFYTTTNTGNVLDFNNYYNPKGSSLILNVASYTISTYQAAGAGGANSRHAIPVFKSDFDLRLSDKCFTKGDTISMITTDYLGNARSFNAPFVGCHEPEVFVYDAQATGIIEPTNPVSNSTSYDVKVVVRNLGSTTISSMDVSYELNGVSSTINLTGLSLATCDTMHVWFTSPYQVTFNVGVNRMRAYTSNINGYADQDPTNDTSAIQFFCSNLSGNYTINPAGSGSTNFKSFADVAQALQSCGISGPVTFTVAAGTYNDKFYVNGIVNGSDATNTITIDGVDASTRILQFNGVSAGDNSVITLTGTKYVTIKNLGIRNMGLPHAVGVKLNPIGVQANDSITISNCIIDLPKWTVAATSSTQYGILISSASSTITAGNNADNLTISGNTINGGYYGIASYGDFTYRATNFRILNNTINDIYAYGMYLYFYHDTLEVHGNKFNNVGVGIVTNPYSIYTYQNYGVKITSNNVCSQNGGYGIYSFYSTGWAGNPCVIANNMLNVGNPLLTNIAYGIYCYYPTYVDIAHNSVLINTQNSTSGAPLHYYSSGGSYIGNNIVNNSWVNLGSGYACYIAGSANSTFQSSITKMDNNNYFSNGTYTFRFISTIFNDLATWQNSLYAGPLFDSFSMMVNPDYFGNCDMHTFSFNLNNKGVPIASVTTDYDGQTRNSSTPDIGADEYTPPADNAKAIGILQPNAPALAGAQAVQVVIENKGTDTLKSLNVHYMVNSGTPVSQTWSGALATGERDTVEFSGAQAYTLITGNFDMLTAFTDGPNGNSDGYTPDDTTRKQVCAAYAGNYSLSSTGDFKTFAQAVNSLNVCGVSAPVNIKIAPGIYAEQVELTLIPGTSGMNMVTFESSTGNATDVALTYASTATANNYIVKLNKADYIRFKNLTFEAKGTSTFGTLIQLSGSGSIGSDSNIFESNIFRGINIASTSATAALVSTSSDNNEYNTFLNNTFLNGSMGIYFPGYTVNPLYSQEWHIEGNTFDSIYYMDLYLYYTEKFRIRNNTFYTNTPYTGHYSVYCYYPSNGIEISGNRILWDQAGSYPMHINYHNNNYGSDPALVFNNFISWDFSSGSYAVYNQYNRNLYFVHNSIYATGSSKYGYYNYSNSTDTTYFINNIITSNSFAVYQGNFPFGYSDYNNYFTTGTSLVYYLGNRPSLAALEGAYYPGSDANSKNINPLFFSNTDLKPTVESLAGIGTPIGLTSDINGTPRSATNPSMGAIEIAGDLMVERIAGLADSACNRANETVQVVVKNTGYLTTAGFSLKMKVNGGTEISESISATLRSGDTLLVTLTNKANLNWVGANRIEVTVNYGLDMNSANNTASLTVFNADNPKPSFTHQDTCYQARVLFTSTSTVSIGSIANVDWNFGNGNTAMGNNVSQTFAGVGPYNITQTVTSSIGCVGVATRQIRILSNLNPGVIGSDQTVCYNGIPAALSNATAPSGSGGDYLYQWQSSTDGVNFSDISGATNYAFQPAAHTTTKWYQRVVSTTLGCGPKVSNKVQISTYAVVQAGSIGSSQTICYNSTPAAITAQTNPTGGDGTFTYQWESSIDSSNWNQVIGAVNANITPNRLTRNTWYRRIDIAGSNCGSLYTNVVKITVRPELKAGTFTSSYDICPQGDPGTFSQLTAPSGGDGTYSFQWQESSNGSTFTNISGATNSNFSPGSLSASMYYRRNVISGSGCGTVDGPSILVNVRALPKAAFSTSNHCFGDKLPLVNASTPGFGIITSYLWDFGNGSTSNQEAPDYTYLTGGTKIIKLKVVNSLGCSDSTSRTANVSSVPQASYLFFYDCNVDSIRFKSTTSINCGTINSYEWDFGNGQFSTLENPTHKFDSGVYNVKFKINFAGGISDSLTQVVRVYPKGVLDFDAPSVCYNDLSTFTNLSTNAGSYQWDFADNFGSNATNPVHLYATSSSYKVKLSAISNNGCNLTVTKTHTVKVRPDADIVSNDRCLGDTTHFDNGSIYAHSYLWDFGDGQTSNQMAPSHLYAASGTFNVKLVATNNNGCVDSTTSNVEVHALPTPSFNVTSACLGNGLQFNNTSSGSVSYAWNFGDGSGSATTSPWYNYANPGKYTVMLTATSGFGCKNSISQSVDVYPKPTVSFTTTSVCAGTQASFTNTSSISSGSVQYMWYFGDGNTSSSVSPTHTYNNAGVYDVKLVAMSGFGCSDSVVSQITIHTVATAAFSNNIACLGDNLHKETEFTNQSQNAQTYVWNFGDGSGSTAANPTHEYSAIGVYTATLTANNANNCPSTTTRQVTVSVMPNASFTANKVCLGQQTVFTNTTSYSGGGTLNYTWFIDGTTANTTNANYTFTSAGNKQVILWAQNQYGCLGKYTDHNVTVYSNPIADFTVSNVCAGTSVQFVNQSTSGTYNWNFGNGGSSTSSNPTFTYSVAGTYTVTLTVTNSNNCVSVVSKQITVYPTPVADFTTANVCQGTATVFTNNSTGASSYNWQFGDGGASSSTNPSYIYPVAGTYSVLLQATSSNGCQSTATKSVTAYIKPKASFSTTDVCLGTTTVFTNTSIGSGNTYNWNFGDGGFSTSTNPTRTYANAGTYNVTLTATNTFNCSDVATQTVNVFALPSAAFTSNDQCLGNNMVFTNQSAGAVLYNWQFGDGSSSPLTHPVKAYSAAGTYNVTLTATNSNKCSHSITKAVVVHPNPVASFTTSVVCQNNAVQLNNTSTIPSGTLTHRWDFGDASTSTNASPQHIYANKGNYVVTLTSTSAFGCASTVQNVVSVQPLPIAVFTADEVCLGTTTVFNNTSENVASAVWSFGDGNNSNALSPKHTYATAGSFNVSLTITANNGCVSNTSKAVVVNANPVSSFTAANACAEELINISNTSTGASNYEWYYGFTGPDKVANPAVKLDIPGNTVIRLVAISAKGCRNESSRTIEVYSRPIADFSVMNTCQGDQTLFVNSSQNAGSYNWQFGDGGNSGVSNPSHQYNNAGSYTVTLTANNARCSDVQTMNLTVNPTPAAGFKFNTSGKEVNFTSDNKTNVKSYDWTFGDGLFGSDADPKHMYNNAVVQSFNVCLHITDINGCVNDSCQTVSINLLGNMDIHGSMIRVYPNPNRGNFAIEVPESGGNAEIILLNMLGVELKADVNARGDLYEISTDQFPDGTYLVKISHEGRTWLQRVIIAQ